MELRGYLEYVRKLPLQEYLAKACREDHVVKTYYPHRSPRKVGSKQLTKTILHWLISIGFVIISVIQDHVPVDRDGKPLKFAVPRGPGGPLERCFDGDISWKAALAWISLKLRSNWKAHEDTAGQTESCDTAWNSRKDVRIKNAGYQKGDHRTDASRDVTPTLS